MKTLLENTIKILGTGHPNNQTIFDYDETTLLRPARYIKLTRLCDRRININFQYQEDSITYDDSHTMTIIYSDNEDAIKSYIIAELNAKLNT